MKHYAMSTRTISDAINTSGLLVVAQWEAKEGEADKVAAILDSFLPEAQKAALLGRIPAGDLGTGEDIAAAVVYLASKEAGYVTGQTLHVNGGMAMI